MTKWRDNIILVLMSLAIALTFAWAAPPVSSTPNRFDANYGAPQQGAVSLKEYFTLWLLDLEKFYEARFAAQEKAIQKQEAAQAHIDEKNNDFRKQLDRQEDTFARKTEVQQRSDQVDINIAELRKDVASLRESRSGGEGRDSGISLVWTVGTAVVTIAISLGIGLMFRRPEVKP